MKRENSRFLIGMLAGAAIGGLSALLLAPMSGEETRERIRSGAQRTGEKARDIGMQAKQKAQDVGGRVSQRAGDIGHKVKDTAKHVAERYHGSAMLGMVDLNKASKEELLALEGVSPSLADDIIKYREEHGGFKSVDELNDIADAQLITSAMLREKVYI